MNFCPHCAVQLVRHPTYAEFGQVVAKFWHPPTACPLSELGVQPVSTWEAITVVLAQTINYERTQRTGAEYRAERNAGMESGKR